jgi:phage terminase large subunit-like protein
MVYDRADTPGFWGDAGSHDAVGGAPGGQAGKQQVLYLTRKLAGYRVDSSPESGDKATRAAPAASQVNVGNFAVLRAPWNTRFLDELASFPSGAKDDQVDALSRAFSMVGSVQPMRISAETLAMAGRPR